MDTQESKSLNSRPYKWGIFQGWTYVVIGVLGILIQILQLNGLGIVGAAIVIYMGGGLVTKHRVGLILFYINALACGVILLIAGAYSIFHIAMLVATGESFWAPQHVFLGSIMSAAATVWFIIPAIFYYRKRWTEFAVGSGTGMKAEQGNTGAELEP